MRNLSIKLTDVELGYLAGMIDGEGCINYYKSKSKSSKIGYTFVARLFITNTNLECLLYLQRLFGFGALRERTKQARRKKSWNLDFAPRETRVILEAVQPYLIIKKQQAQLMIEFLKSCVWGRKRGFVLSQSVIDCRHKLFNTMKDLNHRGEVLKISEH